MGFLKNIGRAVGEAANFVGEKNRKAAYLNRIRTVIQCEEKAAEKEYLALGRYYYNNLRDKGNPVTEPHCAELEAIEARLDKALSQLEKFYSGESREEEFCALSEGCEEITLDDVESFDSDPIGEEAVSQEGDIPPQELNAASCPAGAPTGPAAPVEPARPDENDTLPFEG